MSVHHPLVHYCCNSFVILSTFSFIVNPSIQVVLLRQGMVLGQSPEMELRKFYTLCVRPRTFYIFLLYVSLQSHSSLLLYFDSFKSYYHVEEEGNVLERRFLGIYFSLYSFYNLSYRLLWCCYTSETILIGLTKPEFSNWHAELSEKSLIERCNYREWPC